MSILTVISFVLAAVCVALLAFVVAGVAAGFRTSPLIGIARTLGCVVAGASVVWYAGLAFSAAPLSTFGPLQWFVYVTPLSLSLLMALVLGRGATWEGGTR